MVHTYKHTNTHTNALPSSVGKETVRGGEDVRRHPSLDMGGSGLFGK